MSERQPPLGPRIAAATLFFATIVLPIVGLMAGFSLRLFRWAAGW